ncbi:MAG: zf-HC2 domain-containing protein [Candidatus Sulfotelmatobacter sp.]
MDHDYINDRGVVALYVSGKLAAEERARFEEHFVDCQQCLEQIEVTADLRGALQQMAKEDAARPSAAGFGVDQPSVAPRLAPAPWVGAGFWRQPRLLAYASLVVVLGLAAVFFADAGYRRSELAEARRTSDDWQRRYAEERQARETLQQQMQRSGDTTDKTGSSGGERNPLVASVRPAPLFFLNVTRGADEAGSAPANRVAVPASSPWIALSLEFEKDSAFRSYRARLSDAQGQVVWSAENIPSPPSGAIAITLPAHLLSKGNYSVALDGLTAAGRYLPAAHFSFQAIPQK